LHKNTKNKSVVYNVVTYFNPLRKGRQGMPCLYHTGCGFNAIHNLIHHAKVV